MKLDSLFHSRRFVSVFVSLILTFVLLLSSSVAWLCSVFTVEPGGELSASSIAAYFAGGDGSKEDPYQIERPVHLYNLAWLQYLGIFNDDADGDGMIEQTYFVLNNDVDMTDWTIPPIGTEENPFIGNFNGNGCCVTNVTVSNYISSTSGDGGVSKRPSAVTDIDTSITVDGTVSESKSIIGFFGVIGDWNDTLTGKIADDTQEVLDIPNKVNAVYDLRLDGVTIRSDTDESLMGVLAGYVNGSLQNVGVGSSALAAANDLKPLNISSLQMMNLVSHYSLIGEYNEDDVAWPQKPVLGGWGDSINMLDMYTRLSSVVWPESQGVSYISAETITYDADGNVVSRVTDATATDNRVRVVDMGPLGNYSFSTHTTTSNTTYMYLYGATTHTKQVTHLRPTNRTGDYIHIGDQYLSITVNNDSAAIGAKARGDADIWTLDSDGYLYTVKNNTYYYLNRNDNGNLAASRTRATQWTRALTGNTGNIYTERNGIKYYLFLENGAWTTVSEVAYYYKISNGTYYLNQAAGDPGSIASGTDPNTATLWSISGTDPYSGQITTVRDGVKYFLTANRESSGWFNYTYALELSTLASGNVDFTGSNNNTLSYTWEGSGWFGSSTTRYINCGDNGTWSLGSSGTTLVFEETTYAQYTPEELLLSLEMDILLSDEYVGTTENVTYETDTNATWFPLGIEKDENGNEYVSAGNTGFVVSSSDYQHASDAPQRSGNIRVSQYDRDDIGNSLTGNRLDHSKLYTISYKNPSFAAVGSLEEAVSTWGFTKYADSFAKFDETVQSGNGNIYGLHFMQTANNISREHKITVDGAKVLLQDGFSHTFDGYELPRNAITFNVAEDGYINFFAGTFFTNNENFFSLHHIIRDESKTKLMDIKEISEIYGLFADGVLVEYEPYVYKYTDGTFSAGYTEIPAGYDLIFNTKWITDANTINMSDNRVYYFEVPVNAGEYALGSVAGDNGDGAYLLYLDLAANGTRKVADDPEHAMLGVNFVDDAGLELEDISTYPIISAQLSLNDGVTTHGGVTAAYDRQSMTNIHYQLSGAGADSFGLTFVSADGTTATETAVTVSLADNRYAPGIARMHLSDRHRRKYPYSA